MSATERHYSVIEIAKLWQLSPDTIRSIFNQDPSVLKLSHKTKHKRSYVTLKIPESAMLRVHERLRKAA
jgi:hypothetical protein